MKKILSIILCLALILSLCPTVFAGSGLSYENYLALGDSIPAGNGLDGYSLEPEGRFQFLEGSYPQIIRDAVNATGEYTANGAHGGMRVTEQLVALGLEQYGDAYTYDCFNVPDYGWGGYGYLDNIRGFDYKTRIENADLITVNFGSNEMLGTLVFHLSRLLETLEVEGETGAFDEVIAEAKAMGDTGEALIALLTAANDVLGAGKLLTDLVAVAVDNVMNNGLFQLLFKWDVLMEQIYTLNPDVTVAVLGIYNPIVGILAMADDVDVDAETANTLAKLLQPLFDVMNYEMQYGSDYKDRYIFVDTNAIRDAGAEYFTGNGTHPGYEGHALIAQLVLDALSGGCRHEHTVRLFATKATLFHSGYTGDVFCLDCGCQLEQGKLVTWYGKETELPTAVGYKFISDIFALLNGSATAYTR